MTSFSRFKEIVRAMGGQWAGPHGVFSRTQSEYHAACNGEWVHAEVSDKSCGQA